MRDLMIALLAALGVLAQIGVVVIVAAAVAHRLSPGARAALAEPVAALRRGGVWLAWGVAMVATLGSLWFSEYAHFIPCRLCWFQRIAMYPLVVVLLAGAVMRDRRVFWYAVPFPVIGALISIYHVYIEVHPEAESASCKLTGVPCSTRWIDEFGYITIPVLALSAFALIAALLLIARTRPRDEAPA